MRLPEVRLSAFNNGNFCVTSKHILIRRAADANYREFFQRLKFMAWALLAGRGCTFSFTPSEGPCPCFPDASYWPAQQLRLLSALVLPIRTLCAPPDR